MSNYLTPKAQVIDLVLRQGGGPGVVEAIKNLRGDGLTYRDIALRLSDTDLRVTHETIRAWCLEWGIDVEEPAA